MKNNKVLMIITLVISLSLYGCSNNTTSTNDEKKESTTLKIFTTIFPIQDFTEKIGGIHVEVENVYPANADAHSFEPTTKTMTEIADADALIYNGAGIEGFVDASIEVLKDEKVTFVKASEGIDMLCGRLTGFLKSNKITIVSNWFWTTGSSYHELPERAPALLDQLKNSDLVIFKGDLHYRKLTNDGMWPHLTPFQQALGPLAHETGLSVLSLRTNKADVCVGIESEARLDELNKVCPNDGWVRDGKFAVVSFNKSD